MIRQHFVWIHGDSPVAEAMLHTSSIPRRIRRVNSSCLGEDLVKSLRSGQLHIEIVCIYIYIRAHTTFFYRIAGSLLSKLNKKIERKLIP